MSIEPGMYGLLAPNGAGKSTLMRTIATRQEPDEGSIHLGEIDRAGKETEAPMNFVDVQVVGSPPP